VRRVGAAAVLCACTAPLAAQTPRIEDNSFLIEEAYNQEPGVVQHISTWQRSLRTSAWDFAFTQEWPVSTQLHQASYTILLGQSARTGATFGGILLNYRYQLTPAKGRVAIAPRVTAIIPAHREHLGAQFEVPVSLRLGPGLVAHGNAGVMETPRATTLYNLGGSVVWLARPTFNVLCEVTWAAEQDASLFLVSPGVRWAYNFASGLQIVPGLAYTIGAGPSRGAEGAFLYLSFEHHFRGESDRQ